MKPILLTDNAKVDSKLNDYLDDYLKNCTPPVPDKDKFRAEFKINFKKRCRAIQSMIEDGRCNLIDLLDKTDRNNRNHPQIFTGKGETLRTGNLIGMFEYRAEENGPVEQVIIGDRFGPKRAANDGANGEFLSPFSWAMLESCMDETPLWLLNKYRTSGKADIFDRILTLQLATQLDRAWKKGRFRIYRTFSHYDSRVRGQLDLPRQIRLSAGLNNGSIAYRTREYSEDNPYNQLFLQACLAAEKRQPEWMRDLGQKMPGFRQARQALEQQSFGWDRVDIRSLLNHTRKKITNPVYRNYETLRCVARAVLKRASHTGYEGSGASYVTGIFLDVSMLWEDYLAKAVLPSVPSWKGSPPEKVSVQVQKQNESPLLGGLLKIRPDFLWEREREEGNFVLDAKYRSIWSNALYPPQNHGEKSPDEEKKRRERERQERRDDVYQVLSYMLALNCTHGGVIFPIKTDSPSKERPSDGRSASRKFSVGDRHFALIPFYVPHSEDEAFSEDMKAEARKVCAEITDFFQLK